MALKICVDMPPSGRALYYGKMASQPTLDRQVPATERPAESPPGWRLTLSLLAGYLLLRLVIARFYPSPFILPDELVYEKLAESFARTGRFLI